MPVNPYTWPRRVAAPVMYLGLLVLLVAILFDSNDAFGPIVLTPVGGLGALTVAAVTALHFWLRRQEERWQRTEDRRILGLDTQPSEADEAVLGSADEADEQRLNEELDPRARPRKLWVTYQYVAACVISAAVCFVAATDLVKGQEVTTSTVILIGLPLIMIALGLFLRWGSKNHRL